MEVEQPSTASKGRGTRMSDLDPRSCPCGDEPVAGAGLHLLGVECCLRVTRCVRGYFGPGTEHAAFEDIDDALQECYLFLAAPGRFEPFTAPAGRDRADAFRGWLYTLVERACLARRRRLRRRSRLWASASARMEEPKAPTTPLQAAAQACILQRARDAEAAVRTARWAYGAKCGRRFELLLDAIYEERVDSELLSEQLGISPGAAKKAKQELVEAMSRAFRGITRDELFLEPGLAPEEIEARIDADIDDLFLTAFPQERVPWWQLGAHLDPTLENSDR